MKNLNMEQLKEFDESLISTLATFETRNHCFYIDYYPNLCEYKVFRDEIYLRSFDDVGSALKFIFDRVSGKGKFVF